MESNTQKLIHSFGALADLGQEVADTGDFMEMVRTSLHLLLGTLAIRRGAIIECPTHLLPEDKSTNLLAVWGLGEDYQPQFDVEDADREVFLNVTEGALQIPSANDRLEGGTAPRLNRLEGGIAPRLNNQSLEEGASPRSELDFISRYNSELHQQGFDLIIPMAVRGELTGLVLVGGKASGEPFTADDLEVIKSMVRHIGVGIHTHRLLGEIKQQAVENRGSMTTCAPSIATRCARLPRRSTSRTNTRRGIPNASASTARSLRASWVGARKKSRAWPSPVTCTTSASWSLNATSSTRLISIDAKQSSELNRHPAAGFEILSPIHHPYADIPLMAKYHHERMDGRGYPDGLTDLQIPLGAKIVSLADSFDAMTTDRPYKTRRTFDEVIIDLRRNTGSQFDPIVVAAFCRALLKELNGETKERRFLKMLGKNYLDATKDIPLLNELLAELDPNTQTAAAGGGN